MSARPKGSSAVMAQRVVTPPDALDFYPTPPWATRALFPIILELDPDAAMSCVWEPACGEGHMAETLNELFGGLLASDIFDYGFAHAWTADFLGDDVPPEIARAVVDWVISNPPFKTGQAFVERALKRATKGVAMLVRLQFLEGQARYTELFKPCPPRIAAVFTDRVAMTKGEWKPDASTATAYAWLVWVPGFTGPTEFRWLPPGQKERLTRPNDAYRFARQAAAPLLENL